MARALLYRVAMETGFRRNELASLRVDGLDLNAETPTVSLPPEATKNRKGAAQPIRPELADELRTWLESRDVASGAKLWPIVTRTRRR